MNNKREIAKEVLAQHIRSTGGAIAGSNLALVEKDHIITAKITGTTVDFITPNGVDLVGAQSFPADKLEANKPMVLASVKAEYGSQLVADELTPATTDYSGSAPAPLINGNFKLSQDDRGTLVDALMDTLFNQNTTNNNTDKFHVLEKMEVLTAQSTLTATAKLPAVLDPLKSHFVKITLRGYVPRSK
jgi:hypothetical protein